MSEEDINFLENSSDATDGKECTAFLRSNEMKPIIAKVTDNRWRIGGGSSN